MTSFFCIIKQRVGIRYLKDIHDARPNTFSRCLKLRPERFGGSAANPWRRFYSVTLLPCLPGQSNAGNVWFRCADARRFDRFPIFFLWMCDGWRKRTSPHFPGTPMREWVRAGRTGTDRAGWHGYLNWALLLGLITTLSPPPLPVSRCESFFFVQWRFFWECFFELHWIYLLLKSFIVSPYLKERWLYRIDLWGMLGTYHHKTNVRNINNSPRHGFFMVVWPRTV